MITGIKLSDPNLTRVDTLSIADLLYVETVSGKGASVTYGSLFNTIRDNLTFNLFPAGNNGDGLIQENGQFITRRLSYNDLK